MSSKVQDLFDLSGQVALVTGGSRGLGLQIAEALGEAGATLMLSSRKAADLEGSPAVRANSSRMATSSSGRLTLSFIPKCYRSSTNVSHGPSPHRLPALFGRWLGRRLENHASTDRLLVQPGE